jgi:hypothetical protein
MRWATAREKEGRLVGDPWAPLRKKSTEPVTLPSGFPPTAAEARCPWGAENVRRSVLGAVSTLRADVRPSQGILSCKVSQKA